ncbi:ATP-binding cassette, sub-family E, member 1 [Schistosoma bovis]|uniref:ATP-binding cassette, sub-family E, member 1 n=1 Tax=Schistosoma bovis TaxID=6184 RepID=A0A430QAQ3_SCHBO|nr:ATP-binding cassette, sub-family E, member 1 [Schistosoma bovis]
MLAGNLKPDGDEKCPVLHVSYKPQKISPKSEKTVQNLLLEKIRDSFTHPQFSTDVLKPLQMERLYDQQRLHAAKVIKRFILHAKKTAFVVEHDFIMATYLADRVVVFDGQPGVKATATT